MNVNKTVVSTCAAGRCLLLLVALFCSLALQAGEFSTGLLWKVERPGREASYLFGTMHSDDPEVVTLPPPVRQAFDRARGVTLEVVLDNDALMSMVTSLLIEDGRTLQSMIGEQLYARAAEVMARQGVPDLLLTRMKPWAVAVTLMTPPSENGQVLDLVLYQEALRQDKPVDGLETVAEQMGLFDALSHQDQVALLEDTLDNLPEIEKLVADIRDAWLDRDLARLQALNQASMAGSDADLADTINRTVVVERNYRMVERMQSRLERGGWFIAVGALHLPGQEGLLNLLGNRGYTVTRLY